MLKKDKFHWSEASTSTFHEIKKALTKPSVLALPNFNHSFVVKCDASGFGVGAVLMQNGQPLAFMSQALTSSHLALSTYEKKLLALVMAVWKWRPYLIGASFVVRTIQQALKWLLDQKVGIPFQQRWISKLMGFNFTVEYKRGATNIATDTLSRLHSITQLIPTWYVKIQNAYMSDPSLQALVKEFNLGNLDPLLYALKDNMLYYKNRLVLFATSPEREEITAALRQGAQGGHSRAYNTWVRVSRDFFWLEQR